MRLAHQIFFVTFLISALALSLVGAHTIKEITETLQEQVLQDMHSHAMREAWEVENIVDTMASDLALLTSRDPIKQLATTWTPQARETMNATVQEMFRDILRQRKFYAQIRLIGPNGIELVRLERKKTGEIVITPDHELQDKSLRPYFRRAVSLSDGSIHLSRVELNREHGQIVVPHQPTLRGATPVKGSHGALMGVLVVNLDINGIIDMLAYRRGASLVMLTNPVGDYLVQPDATHTFGFEFDKVWRLPKDLEIEAEWRTWANPENPALEASHISDEFLIALHKVRFEREFISAVEDTLILAVMESREAFQEKASHLQQHFWITMSVICVILAAALGVATLLITRPLQKLSDTAQRITEGDVTIQAEEVGSPELQELARNFNQMLASLKSAAKNEEMASLGRMAAMVAHDLRNALSSVKVNLQVLERDATGMNDRADQRLEIALEQVNLMEDVLQEILTFARAEELTCQWEELSGIMNAVMALTSAHAEQRGISVLLPDLANFPRLWCDRTKLIQAFHNLLENAVDAARDHGTVAMTAEISSFGNGLGMIFTVTDDGTGIAAEHLDHLFEPFFTTRARGTGLGLVIVKRIIEQHGGKVELRNVDQPDTGAVAVVRLPAKQMDSEQVAS